MRLFWVASAVVWFVLAIIHIPEIWMAIGWKTGAIAGAAYFAVILRFLILATETEGD